MENDVLERFLNWRGIDIPCEKCGGAGSMAYPSTTGWRGGTGGMTVTTDVCSVCWGSGDANRHGADLKKITSEIISLERRNLRLLDMIKKYKRASGLSVNGDRDEVTPRILENYIGALNMTIEKIRAGVEFVSDDFLESMKRY